MANVTWKTIASDLGQRIDRGEIKVGAKVPSGEDIAAHWGVSKNTAHRALEELQRQGVVLRQRRWGTVVADRSAVKTGRVGLLVDRFAQELNFPSSELVRGIQDPLGEDRNLVIAECKGDPELEIRLLKKFEVETDGLLMYPTSHAKASPAIQKFIDHGTPLVILDRLPEGIHTHAVMSDNQGATLCAIETLEERGHRRIGFFSFNKPFVSAVSERHRGYQSALASVGVNDVSSLTRWFPLELDTNPQGFVQAVHDSLFTLLKQQEPITALFCVQDSFASAALQACDQMGLSVPGDLELVTFNDWPAMMLRTPWCAHRIVQRSYEIGKVAAGLLLDQIHGNADAPRIIRVPTDFFVADAGLGLPFQTSES